MKFLISSSVEKFKVFLTKMCEERCEKTTLYVEASLTTHSSHSRRANPLAHDQFKFYGGSDLAPPTKFELGILYFFKFSNQTKATNTRTNCKQWKFIDAASIEKEPITSHGTCHSSLKILKLFGNMSSEISDRSPATATKTSTRIYVLVLGAFAIVVSAFITTTMQSMEGVEHFQNRFNMRGNTQSSTVVQNQTADDWEPFNSTNPHKDTFCPKAKCQNSPLCTPCNRRHFLILSTARSGSTTLLRMFNELPNMRLSGENHNQLYLVSKLTKNLLNNRPNLLKHPMDKPTGPFMHNTIPQGSMGCIAQDMMHLLNPPPLAVQQDKTINMEKYDEDLILGFKTVRYVEYLQAWCS